MRLRVPYAIAFACVFAIEILIARYVHDRFVRPHGGDVLAVIGVYCFIRAITGARVRVATAIALGVAFTVEILQACDLVARLGLARKSVLAIVLGSTFDVGDLCAYVVGAALILVAERARRYGYRHANHARDERGSV